METNILNVIIVAFVGIGTFIAGWPWQILILYGILMAIDIITGVLKAIKNGTWSSKIMKQGKCEENKTFFGGLLKKCTESFFILAILIIQTVALSVGIPVPVASILIAAFCFKEFGSIMENYIEMGGTVPKVIKKWFKVANIAIDKSNEDK